jgi:hypothetical protein
MPGADSGVGRRVCRRRAPEIRVDAVENDEPDRN